MQQQIRGSVEMTAAMAISGTIGWFVLISRQPVLDVVFWRCAFGALTLLLICAALGLLRGHLNRRVVTLAALGGAAAAVAFVSPAFVSGVSVTLAAIVVTRWRGRR